MEQSGLSLDQMFVSPRNGEPLVWVYGKSPPSANGMTFIAYEKSSTDGQRFVLATGGMHEVMDDAQFRRLFPDAP